MSLVKSAIHNTDAANNHVEVAVTKYSCKKYRQGFRPDGIFCVARLFSHIFQIYVFQKIGKMRTYKIFLTKIDHIYDRGNRKPLFENSGRFKAPRPVTERIVMESFLLLRNQKKEKKE